jgi:hypothetical protein
LGALPEVGAGLTVPGALPQPELLLGEDVIRGVTFRQRGKQAIGHGRILKIYGSCTLPVAGRQVKPRTAGLYL